MPGPGRREPTERGSDGLCAGAASATHGPEPAPGVAYNVRLVNP
jgi:hypothetical protein